MVNSHQPSAPYPGPGQRPDGRYSTPKVAGSATASATAPLRSSRMRSWLLGALVGLVMLGMLVIGIVTFGLAALALAIVFGITSVVRLFLGRTGKRGRTISPVVPNTGERVLVIGHQPR